MLSGDGGADVLGLNLADARDLDQHLRSAASALRGEVPAEPFLTATVTSPPYGDLLDYGVEGQIGFGQSESEYLDECRKVFATLLAWTKQDGVMWVVADSYLEKTRLPAGVSRLNTLPFTLAGLAESVGWTLRETVIWHKDRTRPWTSRGKFRKSFEYVLLFVKSAEFKFHANRLRESDDLAPWWVQYPERYSPWGKAPENVWHVPIPIQGSWGKKAYQHACPLPPELVRRMLLLTTDEGDVVCDPFAGIGTVPGVAEAMGRSAVALELNSGFVRHYEEHVRDEIRELVTDPAVAETTGPTPETIALLRVLRFPKVAFNKLRLVDGITRLPTHILVQTGQLLPEDSEGPIATATWYFVLPESDGVVRDELQLVLKTVARRPPLSKFGLAGDIRVIDEEEAFRVLGTEIWHIYEHGHTWDSSREVRGHQVLGIGRSVRRGSYPPIAADVCLGIDLDMIYEASGRARR